MKAKNTLHRSRYPHSHSSSKSTDTDFDATAGELDQITKRKLPDGCLAGVLRGFEAEIRQDALSLALRWFANSNESEWKPPHAAAHALRFVKMRYARQLSKRPIHIELCDQTIPPELFALIPEHNPVSARPHALQMAINAISEAAKSERITPANAAIVLMILQDGLSVVAIAKKLGLTRGAVYQHVHRVRAALPGFLANIEEPRFL